MLDLGAHGPIPRGLQCCQRQHSGSAGFLTLGTPPAAAPASLESELFLREADARGAASAGVDKASARNA